MRTRMSGGVGAGRSILPATRFVGHFLLVLEYIIKLSLEWLGLSVVRIQVEQTGSRRVNAVQYELITRTLRKDQKLTLSE